MNRIITILIALVLAAIAPARQAYAGDAQPTKDQLDAAKKAFGEARELYDAGKLAEAVEKFKEAYKLSKKPLLLYNIGHTLDELGQKDKALFYYRKFLADAEKTAAQRKDVAKRVDEIEKENLEADLNGTTTSAPTEPVKTTTTPTKPEEHTPVKAKPAGTYTAADFQHQMIDGAPPGKPLDVTASVPEDAGWTVTLYYRGMGDTKWVAKPMKWRYRELVARIPGNKIGGSTIQYYVDVKDSAGTMVARSGKSTSPNLVNVDASVAPRFYPDLTDDDAGTTATTVAPQHNDEEEDPLNKKRQEQVSTPSGPSVVETPIEGPVDTNPNKYSKKKWIATGIAGGLLGAAVVTYILGSQQASNLVADRDGRMGNTCMSPPCFEFDSYDSDVEKAGKRYNSLHTLTALTGVIAGTVAGYFWYKEHKLKKARRASSNGGGGGGNSPAAPAAPAHDEFSLVPTIGDGFAGAAAIGRF